MAEAMLRGSSYETEFRVLGYDEVERWVLGKGKALRNGKPLRMLGVFVDLTERHRIEQELGDLGGRLINAHEQERIRLSRELHDDIGQRVAMLSAELGVLRQQFTNASPEIRDHARRIAAEAGSIGAELHRLSHELHPARLKQLGLEASIRQFCDDLAEARQLTVHLEIAGVPAALELDAALCLYRVTQEALHNVVKHSGVSRATVALRSEHDGIVLRVIDNGVGFDPERVHQRDTLGLISMRERARMVRAHLLVSSKPGAGTTVEVHLPFDMAQVQSAV